MDEPQAAFAAGRAAFIGLLGAIAVLIGTAFFGFQKSCLGNPWPARRMH